MHGCFDVVLSGAAQVTALSYDGYGRLQSSHAPEQDAGRSTVYAYNADDTVASVTDARGAKAVYGYNNNRRLVTAVGYDLSGVIGGQNVAATPDVTFAYDAAGNRTRMAEAGQGQVEYTYDTLSRLTQETRQFSGLTGSYPLTYEYNLSGGLKSLTDHTGAKVSYNYDAAGRFNEVNGTGFGPATQFASGIEYRAWGGLKKMTYGSGMRTSISYDALLRVGQFKVEAQNQPGSPTKMLKQYGYYADGRPLMADDAQADRFDRAFSYDHVGRLKEAYTGGEARDFFNQTTGSAADGPYRQSYGYDVWGNMKGRVNRFWSRDDTLDTQYINGRRQHPQWQYDASGNVLSDTTLTYTYDAAGRNRGVSDNSTVWVEQRHDGDGRAVKPRQRLLPGLYSGRVFASRKSGRRIYRDSPPSSVGRVVLRPGLWREALRSQVKAVGRAEKSVFSGNTMVTKCPTNGY